MGKCKKLCFICQRYSWDLVLFYKLSAANFFFQDQDFTIKFNTKKLCFLSILKIPTKFSAVPQSFCQNKNYDQDQDFNSNFITTFYTRHTKHEHLLKGQSFFSSLWLQYDTCFFYILRRRWETITQLILNNLLINSTVN